MTDASPLLHTGIHTGLWGTVEVALAVGVLVVSVALVVALLRGAPEGTPEARLVAAFSSGEGPTGPSPEGGRPPPERRGE